MQWYPPDPARNEVIPPTSIFLPVLRQEKPAVTLSAAVICQIPVGDGELGIIKAYKQTKS